MPIQSQKQHNSSEDELYSPHKLLPPYLICEAFDKQAQHRSNQERPCRRTQVEVCWSRVCSALAPRPSGTSGTFARGGTSPILSDPLPRQLSARSPLPAIRSSNSPPPPRSLAPSAVLAGPRTPTRDVDAPPPVLRPPSASHATTHPCSDRRNRASHRLPHPPSTQQGLVGSIRALCADAQSAAHRWLRAALCRRRRAPLQTRRKTTTIRSCAGPTHSSCRTFSASRMMSSCQSRRQFPPPSAAACSSGWPKPHPARAGPDRPLRRRAKCSVVEAFSDVGGVENTSRDREPELCALRRPFAARRLRIRAPGTGVMT